MYCGNCGKKVGDNDLFCENCGNALKKEIIEKKNDNKIVWIVLGCVFGVIFLVIVLLILGFVVFGTLSVDESDEYDNNYFPNIYNDEDITYDKV